jgi:hypothetical protein
MARPPIIPSVVDQEIPGSPPPPLALPETEAESSSRLSFRSSRCMFLCLRLVFSLMTLWPQSEMREGEEGGTWRGLPQRRPGCLRKNARSEVYGFVISVSRPQPAEGSRGQRKLAKEGSGWWCGVTLWPSSRTSRLVLASRISS